jgi:AcrR family transcriptional regulator
MAEFSGRGDPVRSMELLWGVGGAPTRGRKPGLTVAVIVAAAIELADAEGLASLSMRRVGDRLGTSAMALYTYVPGKGELLDLMLDAALGELRGGYSRAGGWRPALEAAARDQWQVYKRHPWMLQMSGSRAGLGPNELAAYEAQVHLIDGLGLSGIDMTRTISLLSGYVRGAAKAVADAAAAERQTGVSDADWWAARSPMLASLADAERFPTWTRLSQEHVFAQHDRPESGTPYTVQVALDSFEFGLQRVLDGIEAHITRTAARPGPASWADPACTSDDPVRGH